MDEQKDFPRHTGFFLELPLEGRWDGPNATHADLNISNGKIAITVGKA